MGYYPCIYLDFKKIQGKNFEEFLIQFQNAMADIYISHKYLLESNELQDIDKEMMKKIINKENNKLLLYNSIKFLIGFLYTYYNKYVMILINSYDAPFLNAYNNGYEKEITEFFSSFYKKFKDEPNVEKVIISSELIPQKLRIIDDNNFMSSTVLDNEFSDDFGITSTEMNKIISDFGIEDKKEEIKKWYDGYKIGNIEEIYNPWSILKYLKERKLQPYWVNTSSNDLIKLILKNSTTVKEKIERLLKDESVEVVVGQETVINGIEQNEDNIWGLLVGTGYLKVIEQVDLSTRLCKVAIPNLEIKDLFSNIVLGMVLNET